MRQQRYNTVAVRDEGDAENEGNAGNDEEGIPSSLTNNRTHPMRTGGTSYTRIATNSTSDNDTSALNPLSSATYDELQLTNCNGSGGDSAVVPVSPNEYFMTVTILDYTHKRWNVSVPLATDTTVLDLKRAGAVVHQIPVGQQRLIFRGALLNDATLLTAAKITADTVVHLFPKPRVVVVNSNTAESSSPSPSTNDTDNNEATTGARVPTIVYDQDEIDRRGDILVLSSMDYIEAVNNVKLFSFMLLIVSSMELLNLVALALGDGAAVVAPPPMDPYDTIVPYALQTDDFFEDDDDHHAHTHDDTNSHHNTPPSAFNTTIHGMDPALALLQTWTPLKYMDVVLSLVGVYVALMGIKASNVNCSATAKLYWYGTCIVAVAWLVYNYTMSLHVDQAIQAELEAGGDSQYADLYNISADDDADVYNEALQVMLLPAMVWCMCIFRAWQFQHLLSEAEAEAAERIAAETTLDATTADVEMTPVAASSSAEPVRPTTLLV